MINKQFIESIQQLLIQEHCVVIPNFGAFVLRDSNSTINSFTKELKPQHSNVYFNRDITQDDGLLSNQLKDTMGLSFKEAATYIQNCIVEIKESVNDKKMCNLSPLGNFFKNAEGEIFFIGNNNLNLNTHTFGLKPIKWSIQMSEVPKQIPIIETIESKEVINDVIVIEISEEEQSTKETKHRNNKFWNVAANVALITFSLGILYMNSIFLKSAFSNGSTELASNIPVVSKVEKEKELSESSIMIVNGEIVQLDQNNRAIDVKDEKAVNQPSIDEIRMDIAHGKGKYFVVGGSYITEDAAKIECRQWNKLNQKATFIKVKGSTLLKVVIKRFESGKDASHFVETMKNLPNNTISVQELTIAK